MASEYPPKRKLRPVVQHALMAKRIWKVVRCSNITIMDRWACCDVRVAGSAGLSSPTP